MVADDDEQPGGDDADRVGARQTRQPASSPEDVREAGRRDRVAQDRDVARGHAVVEQLLDDRERARPHDDHEKERDVRARVHHLRSTRVGRPHREVVNETRVAILPPCSTACSPSSPSSAVVICTPGQDTALTIRNTLAGGRRTGVATAGGVALGQAVWTVAASAGVVALLTASEPVFRALKLVGAAYLVYLGAQSLWAAVTKRSA